MEFHVFSAVFAVIPITRCSTSLPESQELKSVSAVAPHLGNAGLFIRKQMSIASVELHPSVTHASFFLSFCLSSLRQKKWKPCDSWQCSGTKGSKSCHIVRLISKAIICLDFQNKLFFHTSTLSNITWITAMIKH